MVIKRCPKCGKRLSFNIAECPFCKHKFHTSYERVSISVFEIVCLIVGILTVLLNFILAIYFFAMKNPAMGFANLIDVFLNAVLFFGLVKISIRSRQTELDLLDTDRTRDIEAAIDELVNQLHLPEYKVDFPTDTTLDDSEQEIVLDKTENMYEDSNPVYPIVLDDNTIKCPKCGTEQRFGRKVCWHCAVPFESIDIIEDRKK